MNKNLLTQMIYRIVMCCVSALAVLLSFGFFAVHGENTLTFNNEFLKFYTNISNYFVFVLSVAITADTVKRVKNGEKEGYNQRWRMMKFITTIMIMVTFLVVIFLLHSPLELSYWNSLGNLSYHAFAPLLFILDFFLFDEHGTVHWSWPLLSTVIPLLYCVYIFILGACIPNFEYPYFFLDVNKQGVGGVITWIAILLVIFIVLGYLMWLYDKLQKVDGKWKLLLKK